MYKFNLHCHSLLSDGVLLPSEVTMRYRACGYKVIAITDHVDHSNIENSVRSIIEFCRHWPKNLDIRVLPGIELTHLPVEQFKPLAKYARKEGIKIIVAHGESPVEPVLEGTNAAALEADIDILAHPGHISASLVKLAKEKGVFLEVTSRIGHCQTNVHVVKLALKQGARLILNTDGHKPEDVIRPEQLIKVGLSAGLNTKQISGINEEVSDFLKKKGVK